MSETATMSKATPTDGERTEVAAFRNKVGFQFMFVLHSGLEMEKAIDHICDAFSNALADREAAVRDQVVEKIEALTAEWERLGDYGTNAGYVAKIRTGNEIIEAIRVHQTDKNHSG
jgi:hypothetical protein